MSKVSQEDEGSSAFKKRRFWKRAIWVSVAGVVIPPCLGTLGTVVGMSGAFNTLAKEGVEPDELANDISIALLTTLWGFAFSAIFLIPLIISIVRFGKLKKSN